MSFKVPLFDRSTVKSDNGFTVKLVSWEHLRYTDHELVLVMKIDVGVGVVSIVYRSIHEISSSSDAGLSPAQEKKALNNIVDALSWRAGS
jgi:hypothetical protein